MSIASPSLQRKPASRNALLAAAACAGIVAVVAPGYLLLKRNTSQTLPVPVQTNRNHENSVGTITFSSNGDLCRQILIDNVTGRLSEGAKVPCEGIGRSAGGRVGAIRDSFTARKDSR
jgi:hypothetical protein